MRGFAADMAEMMFAHAASDPDAAAAHSFVAKLAAADPSAVDGVDCSVLERFVSETADPVSAAAVARSVSLHEDALNAFLLRPDLPVSELGRFVTPTTAYVLASRSGRPEVLELVFASSESRSNDAVLDVLMHNAASPTGLRVRAAVERVAMVPLGKTTLSGRHSWCSSMSRALEDHPEMQQPLFDALVLPGGQLLTLFCTLFPWDDLTVSQLDRLVAAFEQQMAVLSCQPGHDRAREQRVKAPALALLKHPAATLALQNRVAAALPPGLLPELAALVHVFTAEDRLAALVAAEDEFYGRNSAIRSVFETSTTAELVQVLEGLRDSAEPLQRFAAMVVCWLPRSRFTPDLLAALPFKAFTTWVRGHMYSDSPPSALTDLLVPGLAGDPAAWRTFADLAEVADDDVTVGDVLDLAVSLTGNRHSTHPHAGNTPTGP